MTLEHVYTTIENGWKVTKRIVLASVDLKTVDIVNDPKKQVQVSVDFSKLKELSPYGWENKTIGAYICNDTQKTGVCSDKVNYDVLSVSPRKMPAILLPKAMSIEVWSGRNLSVLTDPSVCERQYTPLVLDIRGDGIKLSGPGSGATFDFEGSGQKVSTGWVASVDDVLLVRDLNGNGIIDDGQELFGSSTVLPNGNPAANGFEALKALDSNGDNTFDSRDETWSSLKLWSDGNFDGQCVPSELMSLKSVGLLSIDLNYIAKDDVDEFGNNTKLRSTFKRTGPYGMRENLIIDVWFNTLVSGKDF